MIVSSVAPPTNRSRCERTVTRAFTFAPIPSLATPSIVVRPIDGLGTSITFGLILVRTSSSTVFPVPFVARSIAGAIEIERNAGFVRRNQRENDLSDVAPRQVMRFQRVARNFDTRFHGGDAVVENQPYRHAAQTHPDHFSHTDRRVSDARPKPDPEKIEENNREYETENGQHRDSGKIESVHDEL